MYARVKGGSGIHTEACNLPVVHGGYIEVARMRQIGDGQYEILYAPVFSRELYPNAIAEYRTTTVCTLCATEIIEEDREYVNEEKRAASYYERRRNGKA